MDTRRDEGRRIPYAWLLMMGAAVAGVVVVPGLRHAAGPPAEEWREQDAGESVVREAERHRRLLRRQMERMPESERRKLEETMRKLGIEGLSP